MPNGRALKDERATGDFFDMNKIKAFATFEQDIINDLIPFIENKYPVKTDHEHRTITGLPMGGCPSLHFGLGNLDVFAWIGAFSSALNTKEPEELLPNFVKDKKQMELLWFPCRDKDRLIRISKRTHEYLQTDNVQLYYFDHGAKHNFIVCKNSLNNFVQLIFK